MFGEGSSASVAADGTKTVRDDVTIDIGRINSIWSGVKGVVLEQGVDVEAADSHDNEQEMTYYAQGLFAEAADDIVDSPLTNNLVGGAAEAIAVVGVLAVLSGLRRALLDVARGIKGAAVGIASATADLVDLLLDPTRYPRAIVELMEESHQFGEAFGQFVDQAAEQPVDTFEGLVGPAIAGFHSIQQRMNPYPRGGQNATFAVTWYTGYVLGQVALMLTGAGIVSKVTPILRTVPYVGQAVRALGGAQIALSGLTTRGLARLTTTITRRLPDVDVRTDAGKRQLAQAVKATKDMPTPAMQRLYRQLDRGEDGPAIKRWMVDADAPDRVGQTMTYLRYTGDAGKQLLGKALLTDRAELAEWLVQFRNNQAFQRRLATAWQNDEVDLTELSELQARYESLPVAQQTAYRELTDATGDDALKFAARTDQETYETTMGVRCDGGSLSSLGTGVGGGGGAYDSGVATVSAAQVSDGDACDADGFRQAVARASDEESSIDSYDELDEAVERIDQLDGVRQDRAVRLVSDAEGDGLQLVSQFDDPNAVEWFFDIDTGRANDMRFVLSKVVASEEVDYDVGDVERLSQNIADLEGVDGLERPINVIASQRDDVQSGSIRGSFSNVDGRSQEIEVAAQIGPEEVRFLSLEYGEGRDVDVLRDAESGEVVIIDSKAGAGEPDQISSQIEAYKGLRGETIEEHGITIPEDAEIKFVVESEDALVENIPFIPGQTEQKRQEMRELIEEMKQDPDVTLVELEDYGP